MIDGLAIQGCCEHHQAWGTVPASTVRRSCHQLKGDLMTWQTPAATDLRFGFEITMYVSAR
jgi:coenzyme PQQ precursor peptide PqqA